MNCKFITGGSPKDVKVMIGENVYIGPGCTFITVSHKIGNECQRADDNIYKSVKIGKGCWIGANVTILPGVEVGDGCIIAAGSVVTKNLEPNYLYAGVPAVKKKYLKD